VAALVVTLKVNALPVLPAVVDVGVTGIVGGCLPANAPELATAKTNIATITSSPSTNSDRLCGRLIGSEPSLVRARFPNRHALIRTPLFAGRPTPPLDDRPVEARRVPLRLDCRRGNALRTGVDNPGDPPPESTQ